MKKVLFTATVDSHILNFHIPYLNWFKKEGYEVHVASNGNSDIPCVDVKHNITFERSPFKLTNLQAYKKLGKIINDNKYELIHCNTPVASVLTRLAAKKARKKGTKVIYTAHGFHFYKGSPFKNWLLYYNVEKLMAKYTDCIITINQEDYYTAKLKFNTKYIEHVHGVGVDLIKFTVISEEEKQRLRVEKGYSKEDFILIYPAELSTRKNQSMLIEVVEILKDTIPNLKLLLPGEQTLGDLYKRIANKRGVSEHIEFLGFRNDIKELVAMSDVSVSSSLQEGLAVNIMEAMASGKPVVTTNCRGGADLIEDDVNGYVVAINDSKAMARRIIKLYEDRKLSLAMGLKGRAMMNKFSLENVKTEMQRVYKKVEERNSEFKLKNC
ncbi:glycosyltransferase family 4 protein [Anaeromicrobium sediminis]|uniref:Glycosyltransferase family 1 protein n=1 Tax=Anaeromicrobium sediminis TaxID=1478221 RepID=A0A267MII6_9FIRM|nr:glycosyltransferase family 4 protein [Anaeromicrobium sediminis]PAB59394.1 glycosyltransferase family 1 protein [Anaeromicrobium sediminis]